MNDPVPTETDSTRSVSAGRHHHHFVSSVARALSSPVVSLPPPGRADCTALGSHARHPEGAAVGMENGWRRRHVNQGVAPPCPACTPTPSRPHRHFHDRRSFPVRPTPTTHLENHFSCARPIGKCKTTSSCPEFHDYPALIGTIAVRLAARLAGGKHRRPCRVFVWECVRPEWPLTGGVDT